MLEVRKRHAEREEDKKAGVYILENMPHPPGWENLHRMSFERKNMKKKEEQTGEM